MNSLSCRFLPSLVVVVFALVPVLAQAQSAEEFTTTVTNNQVTITGFNGLETAIVIPAKINNLPVTAIGDYAFSNKTSLTSVTFPSSLTTIGAGVFYSDSNLTHAPLPAGLTSIGDEAFAATGLTSVTLPKSLTSLGDLVFASCTKLASIAVAAGNRDFSSVDGILFDKGQTTLIDYPNAKAGSYAIPSSVTVIGSGAFDDCTKLTGVTIPDSVLNVSSFAFAGCTALASVTVPDSVTTLGNDAFSGCSALASVKLSKKITALSVYTFASCVKLTKVTLPSGLTAIGASAFQDCSSLTAVAIPNGVTTIAIDTFSQCYDLASVTFPTSLTSIAQSAFYNCDNLTSVTLPKGLTSVGFEAFYLCENLASVTLPATVTFIDQYAFGDDAKLTRATFLGDAPSTGTGIFVSTAAGFTVYFYDGATGFTTPTWKDNAGDSYACASLGSSTAPVITSATTASGTFQASFSYTITVSHAATSFQATGLPLDLALNSTTGVISGKPVAAGTFSVGLSATNDFGTRTATLTLTIKKAAQTISFPAIAEQTYLGPVLTLKATATSGLAATFAVTSGPATVSGKTLTFFGAGAVTVKASQAGNVNYLAAADVSESIAVKAAQQTITFPAITSGTVGKTITLAGKSTSGLTISYSVIPTTGYSGRAAISGAKLTFTKAGKIKLAADQGGNVNYLAAEQVRQNVTVEVAP